MGGPTKKNSWQKRVAIGHKNLHVLDVYLGGVKFKLYPGDCTRIWDEKQLVQSGMKQRG